MLLISFFRKVFFSKQLVLSRTKQPSNSLLISQISSNVRALYIVSALAKMKFGYITVNQCYICLRDFHYRLSGSLETGPALNWKSRLSALMLRASVGFSSGFYKNSCDHNVLVHMGMHLYLPAEIQVWPSLVALEPSDQSQPA